MNGYHNQIIDALVMSGGGARGAYQAGVLYGLYEQGIISQGPSPFKVLVGTSAGSVHAAALAAQADDLPRAILELMEVWSSIRPEDVFRTDPIALGNIAYHWVRDLTFGGLIGGVTAKALLDTSPLMRTLRRIPFYRIEGLIDSGHLNALAIPATEYYSKDSVVFVQGREDLPRWSKVRARVERVNFDSGHVLASSAIPLFFPTVELDGRHFGDGCIRNTSPLAPAIRLGANRILAVGVHEKAGEYQYRRPSVADVAGTVLDAVMMDAMEKDIAHCHRINESLVGKDDGEFRTVEVFWLAPSKPFAPLAEDMMNRIPFLIRYLLRGLGSDHSASELASYLLFHGDFCRRLIDLGRQDVAAQRRPLEEFYGL